MGGVGGGKGTKHGSQAGEASRALRDYFHQGSEQRNDTSDSRLEGLVWKFTENRQMETTTEKTSKEITLVR